MTLGAVALTEAPLAGDADTGRTLTIAQTAPAATQSVSVFVNPTVALAQTAPAATQSVSIPLTRNLQPRRNPDKHPRGRLGRMAGVG